MLRCYFLAVCQGSSIDETSKAPSLFNLIESMALVPYPAEGAGVQIELHAYFEAEKEEDRGLAFETRAAWVDAQGVRWNAPGGVNTITVPPARLRIRAQGMYVPPTPGPYRIFIEARRAGVGNWECISQAWPLELQDKAPSLVPSAGS